ncbi:MAG: DUF3604 domain-containing protein [Halioglobus sp.]
MSTKWVKRLVATAIATIALVASLLYLVAIGVFGRHEGPGLVNPQPVPAAALRAKIQRQQVDAPDGRQGQILFGDLHVHTTVSNDAFAFSLPMLGGEGAHPQSDACDFARYCSGLDFWSINDHAEGLTPRRWRETVDSIRSCNAVAGDSENPDVVAFLGWEWTQMGDSPDNHYGHKNVVLAGLADEEIPVRPIAARSPAGMPSSKLTLPRSVRALLAIAYPEQRSLDSGLYYQEIEDTPACPQGVPVRELPHDCMEDAATPSELFNKLDDWGVDSIVIPHGTSWGNYTPPGSSWRKQLTSENHDPDRQTLVEIYSGHGSAETYRPWRAVVADPQGGIICPEPFASYLPSCWRAGEIIQQRCLEAGLSGAECEERAAATRQAYVERGVAGHLVVPAVSVSDWLDAGQCRDCFIPAFNYRPMGSAQYMLALGNFENKASPQRFRFGFIGSSDNHTARPGTGYKERDRREMTEAVGVPKGGFNPLGADRRPASAAPDLVDVATMNAIQKAETERIASFFSTGGLIAVHSGGRSRESLWSSIKQRQVYGTSGDRLLLWFDLLNADQGDRISMGTAVVQNHNPQFQVRAVGAFKQQPGCPTYSVKALGDERLEGLCRNECYNPSDERKVIERIEVVKITPQNHADEAVDSLIQDPWRVHQCNGDPAGCSFEFTDHEYNNEGRDALYYVRAIQQASDAVNGDNLRCERDGQGRCIKVNPCYGDEDLTDYQDDCLAPVGERAWSSPIFIDRIEQ